MLWGDHVAGIAADEQIPRVRAGHHVRIDSGIRTGEKQHVGILAVGKGAKQVFVLRINVLAKIQYAANNVVHGFSSCRSGNLDQNFPGGYPITFGDVNRLHGAVNAGVYFGFHLHRFGDQHRLAGSNRIAFLY